MQFFFVAQIYLYKIDGMIYENSYFSILCYNLQKIEKKKDFR